MGITSPTPSGWNAVSTRVLARDLADPLAGYRALFHLPAGLIYFDGNSLGPLTQAARKAVTETLTTQWGEHLIASWNRHGWIDLAQRTATRLAPLLGVAPTTVAVGDNTSVNLFKVLAAALRQRPGRTEIVSTTDNFPTDLYMAEGLAEWLGAARATLRLVESEALATSLTPATAIVLVTPVDFRSGRRRPLGPLAEAAHAAGALLVADLAHSTGVMPLALADDGVDYAVGCGYKYLNGGPGAPAYLYVAEWHLATFGQPLWGWLGHAAPFAFESGYRPAPGVAAATTGTPPILALAALHAALSVYDGVDLGAVRAKSVALTEALIELVEAAPELGELRLASPRVADARGSQVAWAHPAAYATVQALIAEGVVGDFRAPNLLRFGFHPLYNTFGEVVEAVRRWRDVVASGRWRDPRFAARAKVT